MAPSKKVLIKALEETFRRYIYPNRQKRNKSLDWDLCKAYKGACDACIWSIYATPNAKVFPCKQSPLPSGNPNKLHPNQNAKRVAMYAELRNLVRDSNYMEFKHKTPRIQVLIKQIAKKYAPYPSTFSK